MTDVQPIAHLAPQAARLLDGSVQARFSFIDRDKVIETQRFQLARARAEELYAHPEIGRPPNLLIHGPSGIGKSHIIDAVEASHPVRRNRATGELLIPVARMEFPPDPSRRWFAKELALALGHHVSLPRESSDTFALLLRRLRDVRTRLIVCEEIGNLPGFRHQQVQEFYGMTRWISNQSKVPIIYTGIDAALGLIEGDDQIARRFERLALKPWEPDAEFGGFIKAYLKFLPLKEPTLCDGQLIGRLHQASGGITDSVVKILNRAAKRAIQNGSERLTPSDIHQDADLPPPTVTGRPVARRRKRRYL